MSDASSAHTAPEQLALIEASSPFFLLVDDGLRIVRVGRSLRRMLGARFVLPTPFGDVFRVVHPQVELELGALLGLEHRPLTLECHSLRAVLRATLVQLPSSKGFLLLASPWITSDEDLSRLGLTPDDFSPHDPSHDLLALFDRKKETIARLEKANERLREMQAELDRSKRAVDESHATALAVLGELGRGLRTPLASLTGAIGLLLGTGLDPDQLELSAVLRSAARQLSQLVEDAVDFTELDTGEAGARQGVVSTHRAVDDALELVAEAASRKGLDLAGLVERDVPEILHVDPTRLRQVLSNLLREAVAHTHAGRVSLLVGLHEGRARFVVEETSTNARASSLVELLVGGATDSRQVLRHLRLGGLGMVLAHKAGALLGAELSVRPLDGGGASISLLLPRSASSSTAPSSHETLQATSLPLHGRNIAVYDESPTHAQSTALRLTRLGAEVSRLGSVAEVLVESERRILDACIVGTYRSDESARRLVEGLAELPGLFLSVPRGLTVADPDIVLLPRPLRFIHLSKLFVEAEHTATPARPFMAVSALSVLVVEDELLNQRILGLMLEKRGISPLVVASGRAAIEAVEAGDFDLVLMDLHLQELDGIAAIQAIRQSHLFRPMIVAVTASASEADRDACIAAGADGVLFKPYEPQLLAEVLSRASRRPRIG